MPMPLLRQALSHFCLLAGGGGSKPANEVLVDYFGLPPMRNLHIKTLSHIKATSIIFYLKVFFAVLKTQKQGDLDAIITRDVGFLPFLYWLKKITCATAVLECHNFFMEITADAYMQQALRQRKKYLRIERRWLPKIDAVLCILTPMADLYKKHIDPAKVFVALPGTLTMPPLPKPRVEDFWIGYVGSYHEQRDFDTVFAALAMVKNADVKLMIIGGRELELPIFLSLAKKHGVQDRLQVTGWVSYAEMQKYMSQLAIGLVPMVDNLYNSSLTAPMKILDYLSCGIPILSSDLPSAREFVGDNGAGLFYRPSDAYSLAEHINILYGDSLMLNKMSVAAKERSIQISWSNRATKIIEIVQSIQLKAK